MRQIEGLLFSWKDNFYFFMFLFSRVLGASLSFKFRPLFAVMQDSPLTLAFEKVYSRSLSRTPLPLLL